LRYWWEDRPRFPKFWRKPQPLPSLDYLVSEAMANTDCSEAIAANVLGNNALFQHLQKRKQ
jgi:hypothetical protein